MSDQDKDISSSPDQAQPAEGAVPVPQPASDPSNAQPVPQQAQPQTAAQPVVPVQPQPAPQPTQPVVPQPTAPQPAPEPVPQPVAPAQPTPQPAPAPQSASIPQPEPAPQPVAPAQPEPMPQPADAAPTTQPIPQPAPAGSAYQAGAPQPQQSGTPQPQQPGTYVPQPPRSAVGAKPQGTAALVMGILSIPLGMFSPLIGIVLGVLAIVFASKAVKATGKNGKTSGGKICGIVGIVVSVISFIVALVVGVGAMTVILDDSNSSSSFSSSLYTEDMTADEQACYDLGIQELEALATQDDAMVQKIAVKLDEGFAEDLGVTHEEIGSSAQDLALWMLTDFSYVPDGVYVSEEDGTATMYADIELRDSYAFMNNFYDEADAYFSTPEGEALGSAAAAAKIGEFYNDAMAETTDMTTYYAAIDFIQQSDGSWVIDESAWEDEIDWMFNIY